MGPLLQRYFELLAGRTPDADYGVIATPADDPSGRELVSAPDAPERACRAG